LRTIVFRSDGGHGDPIALIGIDTVFRRARSKGIGRTVICAADRASST
jgi:hypothetical protein